LDTLSRIFFLTSQPLALHQLTSRGEKRGSVQKANLSDDLIFDGEQHF
jgi:hypothetical protein